MLRKLTKDASGENAQHIPWIRPDRTIPAPHIGPELVAALVQRTKDTLRILEDEGKLTMGAGDEHYY